jgi:hypothetical protein
MSSGCEQTPRESSRSRFARRYHADAHVRRPDAFVLYEKSFVQDLGEFATCVLDDKRELRVEQNSSASS